MEVESKTKEFKINDVFSMKRIPRNWVVLEWVDGYDPRSKKETRRQKTSYHGSVYQVCTAVLNKSLENIESLEDVADIIHSTKQELKEFVIATRDVV